jgi:hypothetical protein
VGMSAAARVASDVLAWAACLVAHGWTLRLSFPLHAVGYGIDDGSIFNVTPAALGLPMFRSF